MLPNTLRETIVKSCRCSSYGLKTGSYSFFFAFRMIRPFDHKRYSRSLTPGRLFNLLLMLNLGLKSSHGLQRELRCSIMHPLTMPLGKGNLNLLLRTVNRVVCVWQLLWYSVTTCRQWGIKPFRLLASHRGSSTVYGIPTWGCESRACYHVYQTSIMFPESGKS